MAMGESDSNLKDCPECGLRNRPEARFCAHYRGVFPVNPPARPVTAPAIHEPKKQVVSWTESNPLYFGAILLLLSPWLLILFTRYCPSINAAVSAPNSCGA